MLNRPLLGQKVFDLLRVLQWLDSVGYKEIHLIGKGKGALAATFAAVLSDKVKQVTLKESMTSFSDVAETELYDVPLAMIAPSVLEQFDLPDCYRVLQEKQLRRLDSR